MTTKKKTQFFYNDALISKSAQQSSFRAVKNLIQAQNNIETVKNRIKVLQMNEQKNINKINVQQQQIQKISMTRNQHMQELRKLGLNKLQRERLIEITKKKNDQFRQNHKNKMNVIKETIEEEKFNEHNQIVQARQMNESTIMENKLASLHEKQDKRNMIVQNQQKSKENIIKFYDDKTKNIYEKTRSEIKKINRSRQKKQKELGDISNIQMEMLQRHSQSQVAYKQMKTKLDTMLGRIRNQKRKDLKEMKSSIHRQSPQPIKFEK